MPKELTRRHRQVMVLVANGYTNTAVGHQLGIAHTTVQRHLFTIFRILGARDRANAVAICLRLNIIDPSEINLPETLTPKDAAA